MNLGPTTRYALTAVPSASSTRTQNDIAMLRDQVTARRMAMIAEIRCVAAQYGHMVEQTTSNEREQVQFRLISMRHNAGHAPRARAGSAGTIARTTATRGRTARIMPYSTAYCDRTVRSESSSRLVSFDLFSDSAGRSSSSAATDSDEPKNRNASRLATLHGAATTDEIFGRKRRSVRRTNCP